MLLLLRGNCLVLQLLRNEIQREIIKIHVQRPIVVVDHTNRWSLYILLLLLRGIICG